MKKKLICVDDKDMQHLIHKGREYESNSEDNEFYQISLYGTEYPFNKCRFLIKSQVTGTYYVTCTDDSDQEFLTLNKRYKLLGTKPDWIEIVNDSGDKSSHLASRFTTPSIVMLRCFHSERTGLILNKKYELVDQDDTTYQVINEMGLSIRYLKYRFMRNKNVVQSPQSEIISFDELLKEFAASDGYKAYHELLYDKLRSDLDKATSNFEEFKKYIAIHGKV